MTATMTPATDAATHRRRDPGRPARNAARRGYWWYLAPIAVGFLAVVAVPFVANVVISLTSWRGGLSEMRWNGLGNYARLLGDGTFWTSLGNSVYMIVAIVVVPTLLGILIAAVLFDYLGKRFGPRTAAVLRATFYLPQVVPIAVAGFIWAWVLDSQDGLLTRILGGLGMSATPDWLGDPDVALYSVMLMLVWLQIGYPVVIFMAALQRIDPEPVRGRRASTARAGSAASGRSRSRRSARRCSSSPSPPPSRR